MIMSQVYNCKFAIVYILQVKLSNFPLSAALTCAKICSAFEAGWDVEAIGPQAE